MQKLTKGGLHNAALFWNEDKGLSSLTGGGKQGI